MSSTLKIPLLILGAWLIRVALKSPNPPAQAKKGDKVILSTSQETFEKYVKYWAILGRVSDLHVHFYKHLQDFPKLTDTL